MANPEMPVVPQATGRKEESATRRNFLIGAARGVVVIAATGCGISAMNQEQSNKNKAKPEPNLRRLLANAASGGGVNLKMMPDPRTGKAAVPLEEVFSFSRYHAICRVDTNPQAFKMKTYKMGEVTIQPHQFFMSMIATSIGHFTVETQSDGKRKITMRGGLACSTMVGQAHTTIGSRTVAESATFMVEAVDGGIGGGKAGDSFAYTAYFDPQKAPINYAIFGPEFTFTGQMIAGEITIVDYRG